MYRLLVHQWKEKTRSLFWQKSLLLNLLLGFFSLYLSLNLILISLFADKVILEIFGESNVIEIFTRLLVYYFSFDLIARFLWQALPTLSIQPYLTLPIRKSTLLHYPIIKSIFSFINLFALLLFLPFFLRHIYLTHSLQFSLAWLITVLSLIAGNNFLNFSLKKYFSKQALIVMLLFISAGVFLYLDFNEVISVSKQLYVVISLISGSFYLILLPVLFPVACYYLAYALLKNNAYIEDTQAQVSKKTNEFSFLNSFGEVGQLISVELKLILRNKRPRSMLYLSLAFIVYGLVAYKEKNMDNLLMLSFAGLFIPGMFSINYGQFLFSWESSFFNSYLANRVSPFSYIKSKHLLLSISCSIGFLLVMPYALIDYRIAFINLAFLMYNIGFNSIVLLFFSTFNTSYIDLGKGQFMNYQGTGITQFLIIIPILGVPILIYLLHEVFNILPFYYYSIFIVGVIGIIFNKQLIELIVRQFTKRKYRMAVGFRRK